MAEASHTSPLSLPQPPSPTPFKLFLLTILCSLLYILGSYNTTTTTNPSISSLTSSNSQTTCSLLQNSTHNHHLNTTPTPPPKLHFQPQHTTLQTPQPPPFLIQHCPTNFTNYCPCQDPYREKQFQLNKLLFYRERHCPEAAAALRCLVPRPVGYKRPFPWPKSRDQAWFRNVPFKKLTVMKKDQNWVQLEGDRLVFPGGGTSFPMGVKGYVDLLKRIVPLQTGSIRTVLDTGCGVASFGGLLMDYNILTMSIAPRDVHEAQVQFALERGLPAMLGVLSTYRLPFPSRSFDMAHCSRCLIDWTAYGGLYLLEIDRILRPGGYWVLSGPPIGWKVSYKGWERKPEDIEKEQKSLEDLAGRLCWKKLRERGPIAVWQKPTNHVHCAQRLKRTLKSPKFCAHGDDADTAWYKEMDACITPLPKVENIKDISGGALMNWPKRLTTAPPRITGATIKGFTIGTYIEDTELWRKRVSLYRSNLGSSLSRYRNVMDMNAGLGGFAAALSEFPVWVMNVVPFDVENNTLGIIYERGLIGTYMNWCEPFSTYPRTYDLIHAAGVFTFYKDRCDIRDILVELYRILRPEGTIIVRDHVDIVTEVKGYVDQMKWQNKLLNSEAGPFDSDKILLVDI